MNSVQTTILADAMRTYPNDIEAKAQLSKLKDAIKM